MKALATATALAALLVAPALAQDVTPTDKPPAPAANPETTGPAPEIITPKNDASAATETDNSTVAAKPFLDQQSENQVLASEVMGAKVYNPADEELGTVNDIVLADAGGVEGVVLGVGGFLGIGAKSVAVPFANIQQSADKDGNLKLVLNASKDELTAAPEFTTLAQLKRDQEISERAAANPEPPADPMAPAPEPPATQ